MANEIHASDGSILRVNSKIDAITDPQYKNTVQEVVNVNPNLPIVSTTSSTVYSDTGLVATITPKFIDSTLVVEGLANFEAYVNQAGVKIKIQRSNDNGVTWIGVQTSLYGMNGFFYDSIATNDIIPMCQVRVSTLSSQLTPVLFKVVFSAYSGTGAASFQPPWGAPSISIKEII